MIFCDVFSCYALLVNKEKEKAKRSNGGEDYEKKNW